MGDIQRIQRISAKVNEVDDMIKLVTFQKHFLTNQVRTVEWGSDEWEDLINEIGLLDQTIWDLKAEKQRLIDSI
jgi:hypothetical protein